MLRFPRRPVQRVSLMTCLTLALALAASATASAAVNYEIDSFESASSAGLSVFVSGTSAEVSGPARVVVKRGGATVFDQTGDYSTYNDQGTTYGQSSVDANFDALTGDNVQVFNSPNDATPAKSVSIVDATIDSCPVGSQTFSGTRAGAPDANSQDGAGAVRPSAQSGDPNRNNPAVVTGSGNDYAATLTKGPLAEGDVVYFFSFRRADADTGVYESVSRQAGQCQPRPGTTTNTNTNTTTNTNTNTTTSPATVAPLDGLLEPFGKGNVKQGTNPFVILVAIHCSDLSKVPCVGDVFARTVRKFAGASAAKASKKKIVNLARRSFAVAPGKTTIIKLKLSKPGQKLLRKQHKLTVRVSAVTRDAKTGKPVTTSRTITLSAKKTKKK